MMRFANVVTVENPLDCSLDPLVFDVPDNRGDYEDQDEWLLKTTKLFVGVRLRPLVIQFIARLANFTDEQIVQYVDEKSVVSAMENVIREFYIKLTNTKPKKESFLDEILWTTVFYDNEQEEIARFFAPFFLRYFRAYRMVHQQEWSERWQSIYKSLSGAATPHEMDVYRTSLPAYAHALKTLIKSSIGFNRFLHLSIRLAFKKIIQGSVVHVYADEGALHLNHRTDILEVVCQWLKSLPSNQHFSTRNILNTAESEMNALIINFLITKAYELTVLDFPRSYKTIELFRSCMSWCSDQGRDRLVTRLIDDVSTNLLTVAQETTVILDGYASCVESLRELDPSCNIMHRVCSVIKEYLKKRPDTVRKIIYYITSDKREKLSEQLGMNKGAIVDEEEFAGCNCDFLTEGMNITGWQSWRPDPPDAATGQSSHVRKSTDVFNMLISVYGSKELFVKEYRKLLGERLMNSTVPDPTFEKKYLDVLKQRFNDGELQQCQVMLKDIEYSLQVDRKANNKPGVPINGRIISNHFWPEADNESVEVLPEPLEQALVNYETVFRRENPTRKLNWLRARGFTELSLEIGNTTIERVVSNANAAIVYLYTEKDSWSAVDVAERLKISKGLAKRRLEWWTQQGLLVQLVPPGAVNEEWKLANNLEAMVAVKPDDESDEEDEMTVEDASDAIDALEVYWNYTLKFIAQNESVKAERIQRMYKLFGSPSQAPSMDTVNAFLFRKVKANLLEHHNGIFCVPKDVKP